MARARLVVGISGASGAAYGLGLLQRARALGVETHLIATPSGMLNVHHELGMDRRALEAHADPCHANGRRRRLRGQRQLRHHGDDRRALLDEVAGGHRARLSDNLLTRAADVTLKERRRLLLMVRETPFNLAHLRNMTAVTEMGGIVFPPLPAFYHRPQTIQALVDDTVERALSLAGIGDAAPQAWQGL
jgi:4-hydroxy-3-polyprenylbenzoate decarboxylase